VFLVCALPDGLNLRRLERYLALAWDGGTRPVIVLNKADLCADPEPFVHQAAAVAPGVAVHTASAQTGFGLEQLEAYFASGATAAFLGQSGVGKSSLINRLLGCEVLATGGLRGDGKGRHTTTHRQLLARPGGGWVIDTPGLRELQLWEGGDGVNTAFAEVEDLARGCRFRDCTHTSEPGCAVRTALDDGTLPPDRLDSYHKLRNELQYLERRHDTKAQAEHRRQERAIHREAYRHMRRKGRID
jgi:ribosome biogenesis GTPase